MVVPGRQCGIPLIGLTAARTQPARSPHVKARARYSGWRIGLRLRPFDWRLFLVLNYGEGINRAPNDLTKCCYQSL